MSAVDPIIHEILNTVKGPTAIQSLAWMMLGGIEDGAKVTFEPLLDVDITSDIEMDCAVIAIHFKAVSSKNPKVRSAKIQKEFDSLQHVFLAAQEAMEAQGTEALQNAMESSPVRTRQRRPRRVRSGQKSKKEDLFLKFVKAANFVRGRGAMSIHPSAKLQLFGLRMQAQHGDISENESVQIGGLLGLKDAALALRRLKLIAWQAKKGQDRIEAMNDFVALVTELSPNWQVAHIFSARDRIQSEARRPMMWVLKINFRRGNFTENEESEDAIRTDSFTSATNASSRLFRITSIEVLQSDNATNARLWVDDKIASQNHEREMPMPTNKSEEELENTDNLDPFIANIPNQWSLCDCIVDKSKFRTIEDQRKYFQERMREMARVHEDEEDEWKYYCKTKAPFASNEEQCVFFNGMLH